VSGVSLALLDGWMIGIARTQRRRRISIERCSAHPQQGIYERKEIAVCGQPKRNQEMDEHGPGSGMGLQIDADRIREMRASSLAMLS